MSKFLTRAAALVFSAFLVLAGVFSVVNLRGFYLYQYGKNGTCRDTGMSMEDLSLATDLLLDYLNDKRDDLSLTVTKSGEKAELFNRRETTHMKDVKRLYQSAFSAMLIFAALRIAIWVFAFVKYGRKEFFENLPGAFFFSAKASAGLRIVMGTFFAFGFEKFWTAFHHVFFDNNLWILDPAKSTMINMFPSPFFLAMCVGITLCFIAFTAAGWALAVFLSKISEKRP